MSTGILATFLRRIEKYGEAHLPPQLGTQHLSVACVGQETRVEHTDIVTVERPPIREIEEYQKKFSVAAQEAGAQP